MNSADLHHYFPARQCGEALDLVKHLLGLNHTCPVLPSPVQADPAKAAPPATSPASAGAVVDGNAVFAAQCVACLYLR